MMITVVDDEEFSRENLRALLGIKGYRIVAAVSRPDAVQMIRRNRPHLVLVSLSKAEDATGVVRDIKSDPELESIPVLMISGAPSASCKEALDAGAVDCMPKPLDTDALVEKIRVLLEQ